MVRANRKSDGEGLVREKERGRSSPVRDQNESEIKVKSDTVNNIKINFRQIQTFLFF